MGSQIQDRILTNELIQERPESTRSDHVAWKRQKIEASLRNHQAHPENRRSVEEVFNDLRKLMAPEAKGVHP